MAEIRLRGLRKRYGTVEAVRGIDLGVPDGQVTVLLGPSGCGKTTTLRAIAGLEEVTEGTIEIGDRDVTRLEPKERDLAMVFQNYALYPHMKVRDNIAFGLEARKIARAEIERRVERVAELLEVGQLLDRKPRALSGGQQQRIAIGRAIVREPAAFLFDEPLSNLDAKLRVEMRTEILKLQRELEATVVHVTHDQEEAMTLAHSVVVMGEGRLVQRGSPADVYREPATEFVASFIGSPEINVLSRADAHRLLRLPESSGSDRVARIGVRPEDVQLAEGAPREGEHRLSGRVEVAEFMGASAILNLRSPETGTELRALVAAHSTMALREGETVELAVHEDALHRFGEDGRRMPSA